MTAIAVALVIVALVAAVAYAGPKFYWYYIQSILIRENNAAELERFEALKESHDMAAGPSEITINGKAIETPGQYI